jgi:type IV secretion system protein VirB10
MIAIVVFTVLLLAIVGAFTTTKRITTPAITSAKLPQDKPFVINSELMSLPESYKDIEGIKKFSPQDTNSAELSTLAQRFNELQNEHLYLKQQLAIKETQAPEKPPEDPQLQQAKNSSLVFSNLSTEQISIAGPQADKTRPPGEKDTTLVPTPEQEKLFKKQAQDEQKLAVIKGKDNPEDIYDLHNIVTPVSPYIIHAGVSIPATLVTGINTSISGTVIAQVRQDIYDTVTGKYLLVPKGSKLLGEYDSYRISYGQTRIGIAFNRLVRPDGSSILLGKFNNADLLGHAGAAGEVNNHWGQILAAATLSTVFSVGLGIASERGGSHDQYYPGARERALTSAASSASNFGQNAANRALNIAPTITLPSGYPFNIIVKKDMVLTPFKHKKI